MFNSQKNHNSTHFIYGQRLQHRRHHPCSPRPIPPNGETWKQKSSNHHPFNARHLSFQLLYVFHHHMEVVTEVLAQYLLGARCLYQDEVRQLVRNSWLSLGERNVVGMWKFYSFAQPKTSPTKTITAKPLHPPKTVCLAAVVVAADNHRFSLENLGFFFLFLLRSGAIGLGPNRCFRPSSARKIEFRFVMVFMSTLG